MALQTGLHSSCRLWVKIRSRDWWHSEFSDLNVIKVFTCLFVAYYERDDSNYELNNKFDRSIVYMRYILITILPKSHYNRIMSVHVNSQ